jgi:hypothetical protein
MNHWRSHEHLAGIRAAELLARLPNLEQDAWQKLWLEVEALLQQAQRGSSDRGK